MNIAKCKPTKNVRLPSARCAKFDNFILVIPEAFYEMRVIAREPLNSPDDVLAVMPWREDNTTS
jgi:hypothetical protein